MSNAATGSQAANLPYYDGDVDFDALAKKDKDFAAISTVSKDKRRWDFQDPKVVQYVTRYSS